MSSMGTSENLARLKDGGVVTNDDLPEPYRDVIDGMTPDEVDILIAVTRRLLDAEETHQGGVPAPGGQPVFRSYLLF